MRKGFGVVLCAMLGVVPLSVAAGESMSIEEIDRIMDETLVYEYANCNVLSVPTAALLSDVSLGSSDRKPTERDIAVEAAMDCHAEWIELVKQLASSRGYEEALRIGVEIQRKMIGQNVSHIRTLPPSD